MNNRAHTSGLNNSEDNDDHERNRHKDTLYKVRGGNSEESAEDSVADNDDRAENHSYVIFNVEQAVEQCTDRFKSGSGIRNKENQDDKGCNNRNMMLAVIVSSREKVRDRKSTDLIGITAKLACDKKEVKICTDSKSDRCPADFRNTREVCQSRKAHQQVRTHIRCLSTHGCYDRSE